MRFVCPTILRVMCISSAVCAAVMFGFSSGQAHNGVVHKSAKEAAQHRAADSARAEPGAGKDRDGLRQSLPGDVANTPGFPNIKGGDFKLVDQSGRVRTSADPDGRFQLVFFGYANCKAICSVALPRMTEAVERLDDQDIMVTPVLITVDPKRDTVETLGSAARKIHSRLVALTGKDAALQVAYDAFQVTRNVVFVHPEHGAVYAHGSYIYLLGPDGSFQTLLPPVLGAERIAEVVRRYVRSSDG